MHETDSDMTIQPPGREDRKNRRHVTEGEVLAAVLELIRQIDAKEAQKHLMKKRHPQSRRSYFFAGPSQRLQRYHDG